MVVVVSPIRIVLRSAIILQTWVMHIFLSQNLKQKKKKKKGDWNNSNNINSTETEEINACLLNKPEKYEKLDETAWLDLDLTLG